MEYDKKLVYKYEIYLDERELSYSVDTESGVIKIPDCSISEQLGNGMIVISSRESDFVIRFIFDYHVPNDVRDRVAELIARINYTYVFGCFFMDYSDGEIGFQYSVDYEESATSVRMLSNAVSFVVVPSQKWGDTIKLVASKRITPAEGYNRIVSK